MNPMPGKSQPRALAIGEKLRAAREQNQISLRELAVKAEMSASMLSQIENGRAFPSVRSMYSIAGALGLQMDYFFPNEDEIAAPAGAAQMTASDLRESQLSAAPDSGSPAFEDAIHSPETEILNAASRPTIVLKGGVTWSRLTARPERDAEFLEVVYAPGATSGVNMSHHLGREFGLVLEGELVVELGFEKHNLREGDSIIFDSTRPHRLTNACSKPARALWVVLNSEQEE
jgi:transcriptional regulator with XRE-family HTH domain